jgi:hypothetical protein
MKKTIWCYCSRYFVVDQRHCESWADVWIRLDRHRQQERYAPGINSLEALDGEIDTYRELSDPNSDFYQRYPERSTEELTASCEHHAQELIKYLDLRAEVVKNGFAIQHMDNPGTPEIYTSAPLLNLKTTEAALAWYIRTELKFTAPLRFSWIKTKIFCTSN